MDELRSILLGSLGLSAAAVVSAVLTIARAPLTRDRVERQGAARLAGVAVLIQSAHFAEELATGFHERFPQQLGLAPWSPTFFVAFNAFWLVAWVLSCPGLVAGRRLALGALWFLGIAGVANGLGHPFLAARQQGYFPGLVTSPALGVAGFLLVRRLASVTRGSETARGRA